MDPYLGRCWNTCLDNLGTSRASRRPGHLTSHVAHIVCMEAPTYSDCLNMLSKWTRAISLYRFVSI